MKYSVSKHCHDKKRIEKHFGISKTNNVSIFLPKKAKAKNVFSLAMLPIQCLLEAIYSYKIINTLILMFNERLNIEL